MRVTADKVTYQEKGGKEIIIDSDDFQRDSKITEIWQPMITANQCISIVC